MHIDNLINGVHDLAKAHPDAKYTRPEIDGEEDPKCYYTRGTAGDGIGCIMGQAIAVLSMPDHFNIMEYDHEDGSSGVQSVIDDWFHECEPDEESAWHRKAEWLGAVQHYQDLGYTWADAVRMSDEVYPL